MCDMTSVWVNYESTDLTSRSRLKTTDLPYYGNMSVTLVLIPVYFPPQHLAQWDALWDSKKASVHEIHRERLPWKKRIQSIIKFGG